ncbi:small acidic protein 1 [Nymphaea colorata]|uniref:Small acidic protein 1 n=1 Tax=Nymphaea colorata TaxID=210225 RepID=A0A5K0YMM4_9MAGN|nr:small acidic protein 1 [Nymphaea colorata]VVV79462.1 unnamed protein product [Nymphaea colorata]
MKPVPLYVYHSMDEQGATVAMDVDDGDSLDVITDALPDKPLTDDYFFNAFEDDFDDSDIN